LTSLYDCIKTNFVARLNNKDFIKSPRDAVLLMFTNLETSNHELDENASLSRLTVARQKQVDNLRPCRSPDGRPRYVNRNLIENLYSKEMPD